MVVGVFDSGLGGLSVLRHVVTELPDHQLVYLADQARAPYGERSMEEVRHYSLQVSAWLIDEGAEVVVMACNSASAAALEAARAAFPDTPFVGMEPAVKPAAASSASKRIGVMATRATFQGELFETAVIDHTVGVSVLTRACPDLVDLVEEGCADQAKVADSVAAHVEPLVRAKVDTIVLGCTHFPFLADEISSAAGSGVEIVDPAPAVARQTARVAAQTTVPPLPNRYATTGDSSEFARALERLLGVSAPIEHVAF